MIYIYCGISFVASIISIFCIYSIYKLNIYITKIEEKLSEQIKLTENLKQSLKEIIAEGFLKNDGRLKSFVMPKERNIIYNGIKLTEEEKEI